MTVGVQDSGCPHAFHRDVNRSHLSCQHPQNHIWVESLVWIGEGVPQSPPAQTSNQVLPLEGEQLVADMQPQQAGAITAQQDD